MKAVYKFNFNCGRQGFLSGVFVEEKELVDALIESKIEVYFGEVLGKHSDICGSIEPFEIKFISDSTEVISVIEDHKLESGYNPFDYRVSYNYIKKHFDDKDDDDINVRDAVKLYIEKKSLNKLK